MELNKMKCLDLMLKIKKALDARKYNNIILCENSVILCKHKGYKESKNSNTTVSTVTVNPQNCPHVNGTKCPYTSCMYPGCSCVHHTSTGATDDNNATNSGLLEAISAGDYCLFRIMPTDIYNGIFFHAIKLHGETCDLKMTFYDDTTLVAQIIETINFLIA